MKESPALQPMNLTMVPATERTLVFANKFMLCDNFKPTTDANISNSSSPLFIRSK